MGKRRRKKRRSAVIRRRNLWLACPCCHWCGKETHLPEMPNLGGIQKLIATLDHLFSRYHPLPPEVRKQQTVLACLPCNANRARQENLIFRDFVSTLEASGQLGLTNRQKVQAFRDALSLMNGGELVVMPPDADGHVMALHYINTSSATFIRTTLDVEQRQG